ncbi:MAG: riboflavin synthase [Nanohaloarchaea archaeon SW_7_43_1]|nr:MAG: riboflavin synthase [Nanohaloarchaea archaeon SW_7_43_1]
MFTGLVNETGRVTSVEDAGEGKRIELTANQTFEDLDTGDSISVSGACLTVEEFTEAGVEIFLAEETLDKTWFSGLREGEKVNLEQSLTPRDRMGGHYVQGHVDDISEINEIEELEEGWNLHFSMPKEFERYIVEKGFITVEGISLTITEIDEEGFWITIIPETWEKTNLSEKSIGDLVNIEIDVMAKYAEKTSRYQN